jgi:hypothetical protein
LATSYRDSLTSNGIARGEARRAVTRVSQQSSSREGTLHHISHNLPFTISGLVLHTCFCLPSWNTGPLLTPPATTYLCSAEAEKMGSGFSKPLGKQLYDAASNGNTSRVAALLSDPKARSFINWQNEVACVAYPSPCFCTVFL